MDAKVKKDINNLRKNIEIFQKELADSLSNEDKMTEEDVSQLSKKLENSMKAFASDAGNKLSEINEKVQVKSKEAIESSREIVADKPLTAVAVSFATGVLATLLLCKAKND